MNEKRRLRSRDRVPSSSRGATRWNANDARKAASNTIAVCGALSAVTTRRAQGCVKHDCGVRGGERRDHATRATAADRHDCGVRGAEQATSATDRHGCGVRGLSCALRGEGAMDDTALRGDLREDKALLLMVVLFEGKDGVVDWSSVRKHLPPTTKTDEELQQRLEFLKTDDTTLLRELPASYVQGTALQMPRETALQQHIYAVIDEVFRHFTQADVRQPSGQQHLNASEIAPVRVTTMIKALDLVDDDVFADIGSGTGSVVAQVVLQSPVNRAIGLEIRSNLAQKSRNALDDSKLKYRRLQKVNIITGDVKCLTPVARVQLMQATVIFSNNVVFQPQDNESLRQLVCSFDNSSCLRVVMLSSRFCSRCTSHCSSEFCRVWEEAAVISALTCWKAIPIDIYVYKRRPRIDSNLLAAIENLL